MSQISFDPVSCSTCRFLRWVRNSSTTVAFLLAFNAVHSPVAAAERAPWQNGKPVICLSHMAGKPLAGAKPTRKMTSLAIVLGKSETEDSPGRFDARLQLGFADSQKTYTMSLTCLPAASGALECFVPCGDGATLRLSEGTAKGAKAEIVVENGLFSDTKGTGADGEVLDLRQAELEDCTRTGS